MRTALCLTDMIQSFPNRATARLWEDEFVRAFAGFERQARRRLDMLDAAAKLDDLQAPPGNRLEALSGGRKGQHSIGINNQWRICFRWTEEGPYDVEIVDYPYGGSTSPHHDPSRRDLGRGVSDSA